MNMNWLGRLVANRRGPGAKRSRQRLTDTYRVTRRRNRHAIAGFEQLEVRNLLAADLLANIHDTNIPNVQQVALLGTEALFVAYDEDHGSELWKTNGTRRLLVAEYQNPLDHRDVNNDQYRTPLDALLLVNRLNSAGSVLPKREQGEPALIYYDVNADGRVTLADLAMVVNQLNSKVTSSGIVTGQANSSMQNSSRGAASIYISMDQHGNVGGVNFEREDILAFDQQSESWAMAFDGSDVGLTNADVNAFHFLSDSEILIGIDLGRTFDLPGLGQVQVANNDILKFTATSLGAETSGAFEIYFDGSDVDLTTGSEGIDAIAFTPEGNLVLSVSGPYEVNGTALQGDATDLLVFHANSLGAHTSGFFEMYLDGSDIDLDTNAEDIWGAEIDPSTGDIYLTTRKEFSHGVEGDGLDIVRFVPMSLGEVTSGAFDGNLFFDGSSFGLNMPDSLDGISIQLSKCDFDFADWTISQYGGSDLGQGTIASSGCTAVMTEGDSFLVELSTSIVIPDGPSTLDISYSNLNFDFADPNFVNDAFEAALLDSSGRPLVHVTDKSRDAFFNATEAEAVVVGVNTLHDVGLIQVDLTHIPAGTEARLVLRLVNNDSDTTSSVAITDVQIVSGGLGTPNGVPSISTLDDNTREIDFGSLSEVSSSVFIDFQQTSFSDDSDTLFVDLSARNIGQYLVDGPLLLGVRNLTDPSIRLRDFKGTTPDGIRFIELQDSSGDETLAIDEATLVSSLAFFNPNRGQFSFDLVVLGQLNRSPEITSIPDTEAIIEKVYNYDVQATDADDDSLNYSLLASPTGMTIDAQTGRIEWQPSAADVGNHTVTVQADDGRGGVAEKSFTVAAMDPPPNRPPVFTSVPVVDAFVGSPYFYNAMATDPDGDPITYEVRSLVQREVTIGNPSFEDYVLKDGQFHFSGGAHWRVFNSSGGANRIGVFNPAAQSVIGGLAPDAQNVGQTYFGELRQTLDEVLAPAVRYEMTIDVGIPFLRQYAGSLDSWAVQFAVGSSVVAEASGFDLTHGRYKTVSLEYSVADGSPWVGQPLEIRLKSWNDLVYFDDVKLTAVSLQSAVPEGGVFDENTGQLQWIPTPGVEEVPIEIIARDDRGASASQTFTIGLNDSLSNQPPIIVSTPPTLAVADSTDVSIAKQPLIGLQALLEQRPNTRAKIVSELNTDSLQFDDLVIFWLGPISVFSTVEAVDAVLDRGGAVYITGENSFFSDHNAAVNQTLAQLGSSMSLVNANIDIGGQYATRTSGQIVDHPLTEGVDTFYYSSFSWIEGALPENELIFSANLEKTLFAFERVGNGTIYLIGDINPFDAVEYVDLGNNAIPIDPNDNDQFFLNVLDSVRKDAPPYEYQVNAIDGDGDTLSYALITAPEGMQIDPHTGLIRWQAPTEAILYGDTVDVTVQVSDGIAVARQSFELSLLRPGDAAITGRLFDDSNGNEELDAGEQGLPDRTVYDDANNNARRDVGEWSVTTDGTGRYQFRDLQQGTYLLRQDRVSGWASTFPRPGFHQIAVAAGETVADINFGSQLGGSSVNHSPQFTTTPPTSGIVGQLYGYPVAAEDIDRDIVEFALAVHPDGMFVNQATSDVFWQPSTTQVGRHDVLLRARDGNGGVAIQAFEVHVAAGNTAPIITSTPVQQAVVGLQYQYRARAQDAEEDTISYRIVLAPAGVSIDESTGVLDWPSPVIGDYEIVLDATDDSASARQSYVLSVVADAPNVSPVIQSTPRINAVLGHAYRYWLDVFDPDSDPIEYFLDQAPTGMTLDAAGLLQWTPTSGQLGSGNAVKIRVEDGRGGVDTQDFTIDVVTQRVNSAPTITSDPKGSAVVGASYAYDAVATDPDHDPIVWQLGSGPSGMSLDPLSGAVRWTPTSDQIGEQAVELVALDGQGGSDSQSIAVLVRGVNTPPMITSTAITAAFVDKPYIYTVGATDVDGDMLQSIVAGPPAMTIDSVTGLLEWMPSIGDVGTHTITVAVSDGQATSTQVFDIVVSADTPNNPPVILSRPDQVATAGIIYSYDVDAADADGDPITYLLVEGPAAMTIDSTSGLVQWNPAITDAGAHTIMVAAIDFSDFSGIAIAQRYALQVFASNEPPVITSAPATTVAAGATYRYDVRASDPDSDLLQIRLTDGPVGMQIDTKLGRIVWTTTAADVGAHNVQVTVSDGKGGVAVQSFAVEVGADVDAPLVNISLDPNPANVGDTVAITINATDNVGVASVSLIVGGTPVVIDSLGLATFVASSIGLLNITATATDAAGNVGETTTTLNVGDPSDVDAPVVAIHSPAYGDQVTGVVDVIGTASDDTLVLYTLSYAPLGGGEFIEIASGTDPVIDGVLGRFDPTLLGNDTYIVQLFAQDAGGKTSVEQILVEVTGELKIGNFTLSFTDLSIPVSGIPITVARTYDSLNASSASDFGFGWRLEFADADIRTSVAKTEAEEDLIYNPFYDGARVYVTLPGGKREGFTFRLNLAPGVAGRYLGILEGEFVPDTGVTSTLTAETYQLRTNEYGEALEYLSAFPWNPLSPTFGGGLTLTTVDGTRFTLDGTTGDVREIADRNDNRLTFREDGIVSSDGQQVRFERDPQGRIVAVIDPQGGRVGYQYDASGNLAAVTDREGNTTRYLYGEPARPHYLTEVIDPLGRTGIRSEYDADGRLIKIIDADGKEITLAHDPASQLETITNQLGHPTVFEYDDLGNVIREVDAEGGVTLSQYGDSRHPTLETSITRVLNDGTALTTTYAYDPRGNVTVETDPAGNVTRTTYDTYGNVLTSTDPLGNTLTNRYDASGNLLSLTDAGGMVTSFTYDTAGNPLMMSLPGGNTQSFVYDGLGRVASQTDPLGNVSTFTYDTLGNQLTETRTQTTASGLRTIVTESEYDTDGRVRFSRLFEDGVLQSETETRYDAVGNRIEAIDTLGHSTQFVYDDRGLLTETIYADATPTDDSDNPRTKTEYDAAGQTVATIDELGRRTELRYDGTGRQTQTIFPDSTPSDLSDNPRTTTEYDLAGRTIAVIDELGNRTEFEYNAVGNQTIVRDALLHETNTYYDIAGRQLAVTSPLGHTTQFVYDDGGRPVQTILADGSKTQSVFDEAGRLVQRIDQAGVATDYEYDAVGRLTAVVLAEVDDPFTGTRVRPRTEYEYDDSGNMVVQRGANGNETRFEYDGQGRRTATIQPLGQRSGVDYNAVGQVTAATDFNGDTITFEYNERGRLVSKQFPDTTFVSYTYTATGQPDLIVEARGTTDFDYDERGRLTSRTDPDGRQISYTYDAAGNRTSLTIPSGITQFTFDTLNRLETVVDPDLDETRYAYDAESRLTRTELPNGTVELRDYDTVNRLQSIEHRDALDAVFASFVYELDPVGNRTAVTEQDGRRVEYDYDELYRLTGEDIFSPGAVLASRTFDYEYDLVGNRLSRNDSDDGLTTYDYDDNDRLLQETTGGVDTDYTYDDNGNTLSKVSLTDQVFYEWDVQNRLIAADTDGDGTADVTYEYDADGMRVSQTVNAEETRFLLDKNRPYAQVLEEYTPGGILKVSYVHGHDLISQDRLQEDGITTAKSFYHVDGLGSTRALSNALGLATDGYIYDAFGRTIGQVGSTGNVYLFAGEQRDSATGLDYLRARWMDTGVGRFVSRDSFDGKTGNTISLHRYLYGGDNPATFVDPSGQFFSLPEVNFVSVQRGAFTVFAKTVVYQGSVNIIIGALVRAFAGIARGDFEAKKVFDIKEIAKDFTLGAAIGAFVNGFALIKATRAIQVGIIDDIAGNSPIVIDELLVALHKFSSNAKVAEVFADTIQNTYQLIDELTKSPQT